MNRDDEMKYKLTKYGLGTAYGIVITWGKKEWTRRAKTIL